MYVCVCVSSYLHTKHVCWLDYCQIPKYLARCMFECVCSVSWPSPSPLASPSRAASPDGKGIILLTRFLQKRLMICTCIVNFWNHLNNNRTHTWILCFSQASIICMAYCIQVCMQDIHIRYVYISVCVCSCEIRFVAYADAFANFTNAKCNQHFQNATLFVMRFEKRVRNAISYSGCSCSCLMRFDLVFQASEGEREREGGSFHAHTPTPTHDGVMRRHIQLITAFRLNQIEKKIKTHTKQKMKIHKQNTNLSSL